MTLSSHPGFAITLRWNNGPKEFNEFKFIELVIGPASDSITMCASVEGNFLEFNLPPHNKLMVLDVAHW